MFRECSRCHVPYPNKKYFKDNNKRCNACQQKSEREKEKREQRKKQLESVKGSANTVDLVQDDKQPKRRALKRPAVNETVVNLIENDNDDDDNATDDNNCCDDGVDDWELKLACKILRRWKSKKRRSDQGLLLWI